MTTSFTPALKLRRRSFSGKRWKMPPRAPLSASVAVMRPLTKTSKWLPGFTICA